MILLNAPILPLTEQSWYLPCVGGAMVTMLGLAAGLGVRMRRAATSRISAASLVLAVIAIVAALAVHALAVWKQSVAELAGLAGPLLVGVFSVSSFLLGIVGLATYDKKVHSRGFGQAIAGMALGVAFTIASLTLALVNLVVRENASKAVVNVTAPAWGYATRLDPQAWQKWPDHNQALADFAALRTYEAVTVSPVDLGEDAPDIETVATALLRRWDVIYPSEDGLWKSKTWPSPWGDGLEITGSKGEGSGAFDYMFRVVTSGRLVQVHAGWASHDSGSLQVVRRALDSIQLLPPQPPPPSLPPAKTETFSLVCNDLGIVHFRQKDFTKAAHWFVRALRHAPADGAIFSNAADAFVKSGNAKEGLKFVEERIGAFPKNIDAHVHHAYLLSANDSPEEANKAFQRAIDAGLNAEETALDWLRHLNNGDQYALAEKAAEAWMKKHRTVNSRRWHAQTVGYAGDDKRGLQLLEELSKELPDDKRVTYDLGEALNRAGEHAKAAEAAEKLLADGKEAQRAMMILGWSQMGRKWYREAKQTFERVAAKSPDDEDVKDALREASSMLGQGSDSDIKTPIAAVSLPESLKKLLEENPAAAGHGAGQPYAWLLTAKGYSFEPGKPARRTWLRRARIQTTEGASSLSSIEYSFNPVYERIFINLVRVKDESGNTLASAPGDAYVMDLDSKEATHRKKLHFQIPALRPGCVVEYQITIEDRSPAKTFSFERYQFGDSAADVVFVTGAVDEVQVSLTGAGKDTLRTVREKGLLAWAGFNLPYDRDEPLSGMYEDRVPHLCLGGKEGGWKEIGETFLKEIEDRLKPEQEVTGLAQKLTSGMKEPLEKIAALSRLVQKQVSYTAIEFGTRARRPNNAAQTLQHQYGDCKDQALLLHQLLKAAGIENHLALVNTSWRTQPTLPTLDQFNHMVVHVPALGKGWLIDPTDKMLPGHLWHADSLWHSHAFILEPGRERLAVPVETPRKEGCRVESSRTISPEGDAWHVNETFVLHGYYASWMRGAFTGVDAAGQLRKMQGLLEKNGRVQVHSFTFENLDDIASPARLVISYDVPGRLHAEENLVRATLPALWEHEYLETTFVKEREAPFTFRYPFSFRTEATITGVPGLAASSAKALDGAAEGEFTRWKMSSATSGAGVRAQFEFDCVPGTYPAASYSKWHTEWNAALKCWDQPVQWKTQAGQPGE